MTLSAWLASTSPTGEHEVVKFGASSIWHALCVGVVIVVGGCAAQSTPPAASDPCSRRVDEAVSSIDEEEVIESLDAALYSCENLPSFEAALAAEPTLLGHSAFEYAALRCRHSTETIIRESSICAATVIVAATGFSTAWSSNIGTPVDAYDGVTLDGRVVTIEASDDLPFVDGLPTTLRNAATATGSQDCARLREIGEQWQRALAAVPTNDAASVFARSVDEMRAYIGC